MLGNLASFAIDTDEKRVRAIEARRSYLAQFGVEPPSQPHVRSLARDLAEGKRVAVEGGFITTIRKVDKRDRTMEFVCSTEGQKRDGNIVRANGFRFGNFDRNPIGTWSHRYDIFPVSRWVERQIGKDKGTPALIMTAQFVPPDADEGMGEKVFKLYNYGFLSAVSIGWEPLKYRELKVDGLWAGYEFTEQDLLECAHVLIPADPDALKRACVRGVMTDSECAAFARWAELDRASAYVIDWREKNPPKTEVRTCPYAADDDDEAEGKKKGDGEKERAAAAAAQRDAGMKTCPDCGAEMSENAESCTRCGTELRSLPARRGKRLAVVFPTPVSHEQHAGVMRQLAEAREQGRDLVLGGGAQIVVLDDLPTSVGTMQRGALASALDPIMDRLKGDGYLLWEHIQSLGYSVDTIFYAESGVAYGPEGLARETLGYIARTRARLAALATSLDSTLGALSDAVASVAPELPAGADGPGSGAVLIQAASGDGAAAESQVEAKLRAFIENLQARVGKKIARSRLDRLSQAHDGMTLSTTLLREVIDEALEEAQAKVDANAAAAGNGADQQQQEQGAEKTGDAEGNPNPEKEKGKPNDEGDGGQAEGDNPPPPPEKGEGKGDQGDGDEPEGEGDEADEPEGDDDAKAKKAARVVDVELARMLGEQPPPEAADPLLLEIEAMVAEGKQERDIDAAARSILAGLDGSE